MRRLSFLVCFALATSFAQAQSPIDYNAPFPPHRVMDNLYFVGTAQLGSFLITTPAGNILINSDFESTVPSLQKNVQTLGFKFTDIKILLGSHAHGDHMEGDALVKQLTGATVFYGLQEQYSVLQRRKPGDPNPFVDHAGYLAHIATQEKRFQTMLETQRPTSH
jgi:glyoxylase-like metal-dependent hydrolase (beta-lactamase superfamily II)